MPKIITKKQGSKPYYYITKRCSYTNKSKKIQVYIGKSVPKALTKYYKALHTKELQFVIEQIGTLYRGTTITTVEYINLEKARLDWEYAKLMSNSRKVKQVELAFAIRFIFESNSIEGSKLQPSEVEAIIRNKYIKKSLDRREVREVQNSIKAFTLLNSGEFKLNQRSIIALHSTITNSLGIQQGYKRHNIIVNNKETTKPGRVRQDLAQLLDWWRDQNRDRSVNKFELAIKFHQRFEHIHPFEDGNGRTGRMILNWMLQRYGYGPILFKVSNRRAYFNALDKADGGRYTKLVRLAMKVYRDTVAEFAPMLRV